MTRDRRWSLERVWTNVGSEKKREARRWTWPDGTTNVEPWACGVVLVTPWFVVKFNWPQLEWWRTS